MARELNEYFANGVSFADTSRPDVDELVSLMPDEGTVHLAVLRQPYIDLIADGIKTIESRFNTKRAAPFGKIAVADLVLLKAPGRAVTNYFFAAAVKLIDLAIEPIDTIREQYAAAICAQDEEAFWQAKTSSRYCTLIEVGERGLITPELSVSKKDQRGWVTFVRRDPTLF